MSLCILSEIKKIDNLFYISGGQRLSLAVTLISVVSAQGFPISSYTKSVGWLRLRYNGVTLLSLFVGNRWLWDRGTTNYHLAN